MVVEFPSLLEKVNELEEIIIAIEKWTPSNPLPDNIAYKVGSIADYQQREEKIKFYKENLETIRINLPKDDKLYLSQIIEKENIKFKGTNNLILAPVGSGKSTLIKKILEKDPKNCLMLVSNTALKNSISPEDNETRRIKSNRTYTTQNKNVYGEQEYTIYVMSYAEFGSRIRINDDFLEDFEYIFCDEIHSLPNFQRINDSTNLSHAMKSLFSKHHEKTIYYFTATDEYLIDYEKKNPGALRNVTRYDFRKHPSIKKYTPLSEYKFYHIEQIRHHLKARFETFKYFGYKCLAFSRTIEGQKRIAKIAEEEGFIPLVLWSINNKSENYQMSKEQLRARNYLLENGVIPEPYDFLIINSAMQEGWDLFDMKVKLVIMNTTSETEKIQATGRLRNDIDILAYKVKAEKGVKQDSNLVIPDNFINTPLTKKEKDELCSILDFRNSRGSTLKWKSVKDIISEPETCYQISEGTKTIDGKRTRITIISIKKNYE